MNTMFLETIEAYSADIVVLNCKDVSGPGVIPHHTVINFGIFKLLDGLVR